MYLDPGFGSMVIQMAVATVAAGGAVLFTLRNKIAQFFGRSSHEDAVQEEQAETVNKKDE